MTQLAPFLTDDVLVKWMQGDNETERKEAGNQMVVKYQLEVERYVRFRSPLHYQDICQDTFMFAYQNIASRKYEDRGKPLICYLKGIAKNLIRQTNQASQWQSVSLTQESLDGDLEEIAIPSLSKEAISDWRPRVLKAITETRNPTEFLVVLKEIINLPPHLQSALNELKERHQLIFLLYSLKELSPQEVATILGMTPVNLRVTYHRIKKKLDQTQMNITS